MTRQAAAKQPPPPIARQGSGTVRSEWYKDAGEMNHKREAF